MPARRQPDPPLEIRHFTPEQAAKATGRLQARIDEVAALDPDKVLYNDERVHDSERRIRSTVLDVFSEHSPEYRDHQYHRIVSDRAISAVGWDTEPREREMQFQQRFAEGIPRTITMLKGLIQTVGERTDASDLAASGALQTGVRGTGNKAFVVHGRKEGPREAVARLIARLGLEPIILQEQASGGRTLIEKFERHSDVALAVVLLTGDDRGGPADSDRRTYALRARQNVILELGYFVGKLGRARICVVYEDGVELPSDIHGVVYVPLDTAGAWKVLVAKEMKAADLDVDLNRAI